MSRRGVLFLLIGCVPIVSLAGVSQGDLDKAERLTLEALSGSYLDDAEGRETLLRRAIYLAPDYAPARWALGEIDREGEWLTIESIQSSAAIDERIMSYSELSESINGSPGDHLRLAQWSRRRGLNDQARYHWLKVLQADPGHRQALGALGLVWVDGQLLTNEEAREKPKRDRQQEKARASWRRRIARWEKTDPPSRSGAQDPTLKAIRSEADEHAAVPFEDLAGSLIDTEHRRYARRRQLVGAYLDAMGATPTYGATASLVRFAVLTPDETLREQAAEALVGRPMHESVPLLLTGLRSPMESRHQVSVDRSGNVSYRHEVVEEGRAVDRGLRREQTARVDLSGLGQLETLEEIRQAVMRSQFSTLRSLVAFHNAADQFDQQIDSQNQATELSNQRVSAVLSRVTGEYLDTPREWWDYWTRYDGYEVAEYRPTDWRYEQEAVTEPIAPYRPPCECFAAGTPVWTNAGLVAIESLEPGDLVLAKDTQTGELMFRPVLDTTVRKPSPVMELSIEGESFISTTGHPLWVANAGWKMAKRLSTGEHLATVRGAAKIEKVETAEEAPTYNLIVEGAANYFVGRSGVLAHDATPRRPDRVRVAKK